MDHTVSPETTSSILTEKRPSQSSEVHRGKGKRKGSIATKGLTEDKKVPPRAGSRPLAEANACRPLKLQLQRHLHLARGPGIGRPETLSGDGVDSPRRGGCGKGDVERIPSLYGQDGRQFPSADEAVAFEGQVVNGIRYEPMPGVEIGTRAAAENV